MRFISMKYDFPKKERGTPRSPHTLRNQRRALIAAAPHSPPAEARCSCHSFIRRATVPISQPVSLLASLSPARFQFHGCSPENLRSAGSDSPKL